ncbi:hypothetical protein [Ponticaulis profundi]|uniref:Uncharacterized protein n=1 Tax=Ponticaulis profundi TaxID=2665222 RepID=A0ABW1S6U2_9PROT
MTVSNPESFKKHALNPVASDEKQGKAVGKSFLRKNNAYRWVNTISVCL